MEGKNKRKTRDNMLLDQTLVLMDKNGNRIYEQLKEMTQCREDWHHWCTDLPEGKAPEEVVVITWCLHGRLLLFLSLFTGNCFTKYSSAH